MAVQGVVLVGGLSRRMGRHKAAMRRGSFTQAQFLNDLLAQVTGHPAWQLGQCPGLESTYLIQDREPGSGPLSAILGLFDVDPSNVYLVLACDFFAMTPSALEWLLDQDPKNAVAVWPRFQGRSVGEPLCSLYFPAARAYLELAWQSGERAITRAIPTALLAQPIIPVEMCQSFTSANTPDELVQLKGFSSVGSGEYLLS